jgi:hypothetical protein
MSAIILDNAFTATDNNPSLSTWTMSCAKRTAWSHNVRSVVSLETRLRLHESGTRPTAPVGDYEWNKCQSLDSERTDDVLRIAQKRNTRLEEE